MTTLADLARVERELRAEYIVGKSGYVPNELDWADTIAAYIKTQGWQPIETAPRDGHQVDLWAEDCRFTNCWWRFGRWVYEVYPDQIEDVKEPTHWMPLPEPPK